MASDRIAATVQCPVHPPRPRCPRWACGAAVGRPVIVGNHVSLGGPPIVGLPFIEQHRPALTMSKPKLIQQVLEVRYEKGYRFLDRTGEVMLILEEMLPSDTGKVWMPEDIAPTGANLKCPDLDLRIVFNTYHLIVDQNPAEQEVDLASASAAIFATLSARFDIRRVTRLGFRTFHLHPADSIEEAESMSVKMAPFAGWPEVGGGLIHHASEATASFESNDGSEGLRVSVKPTHRIEAPQEIDPRLKLPVRLLAEGQKDALIAQQRRRSQREKSPLAGVLVDIDCYRVQPGKVDVAEFIRRSTEQAGAMALAIRSRSN